MAPLTGHTAANFHVDGYGQVHVSEKNYYNANKQPSNPWTVPREVSRLYTGRRDVGEKLALAFKRERVSQKRFVISGLGGTGKSEICLKFAEDHRKEYWGVSWIDYTNDSNAQESFKSIGRLCGIDQPDLNSVKNWLSSTEEPWLLIVDNADDHKTDYAKYFPAGGNILMTTRNPSSAVKYSTVGHEALEQLDIELATVLLLRAAGFSPVDHTTAEKEAARQIVKELGCHTLAIVHAGTFVADSCDLEDYLGLYFKQRDRLFKYERDQEHLTYRTVHATFEVSVERLEQLRDGGAVDAGDAIDLLAILAFLHHEGEVESILASANEFAIQVLEDRIPPEENEYSKIHAEQIPQYSPGQTAESKIRRRQACKMLSLFSLITIQGKDEHRSLTLHPLVHTWAKERQEIEFQVLFWFKAACILALSARGSNGHGYLWILKTHVRACLHHQIDTYVEEITGQVVAWPLLELVWIQYLVFEEDDDPSKTTEDDDPLGLHINLRFLKAERALRRGDVGYGQEELEHIVSIHERTLHEGDQSRLSTQRALARAYLLNDEVKQAIDLLERVVRTQANLNIDETHRERLLSQTELGKAYLQNKQTDQAIELLEHILRIQKSNFNEVDAVLLITQGLLARAYLSGGQIKEAVELLDHIDRTLLTA